MFLVPTGIISALIARESTGRGQHVRTSLFQGALLYTTQIWSWVPGASWDEHWEALPQGNVILLRQVGGRLERVTGDVSVAGGALHLKDPGPPVAWPPAQLYQPLLR